MKILVTGGAGYIGSLLVPKLLEKFNCKVTIIDYLSFGISPILHFISDPRVTFIYGDVRDEKLMNTHIPNHDAIIHLAAIVGFPACSKDPNLALTINQEATLMLTKKIKPGQKIIYASTGSSYGAIKGICDENTPINPLTLYGKTKAIAEKACLEVGGVGLRFATVYGVSPRMRLDLLINDFVYQAIHNKHIILFEGHFRRTFMHIKDIISSIIFSLENFERMTGETFNIGTSTGNYTKLEIAKLIKERVDYHLYQSDVGHDADQRDYEVSYDKVEKLGFKCQIDLIDGLNELIKVSPLIQMKSQWKNV